MPAINDIVHVCVNEVYRPKFGDYAEAYIDKTYYIVTHIYKNGNVRLWNYFDDKAPGIRVCRSWIKVGTWGDNKNKVFKKIVIKNILKNELRKLRIKLKENADAASWIMCDPSSTNLSVGAKKFLQSIRGDEENIFNQLRIANLELTDAFDAGSRRF